MKKIIFSLFLLTSSLGFVSLAHCDYEKRYVQNRLDYYIGAKSLHLDIFPDLETNPSFIYDPNYQYGYIIGSIDAYRNMENLLD
jgi:hypothetical protein